MSGLLFLNQGRWGWLKGSEPTTQPPHNLMVDVDLTQQNLRQRRYNLKPLMEGKLRVRERRDLWTELVM